MRNINVVVVVIAIALIHRDSLYLLANLIGVVKIIFIIKSAIEILDSDEPKASLISLIKSVMVEKNLNDYVVVIIFHNFVNKRIYLSVVIVKLTNVELVRLIDFNCINS